MKIVSMGSSHKSKLTMTSSMMALLLLVWCEQYTLAQNIFIDFDLCQYEDCLITGKECCKFHDNID